VIEICWSGRVLDIEIRWFRRAQLQGDADCPLVVFLHEGLGSVSAWGEFPERLCDALTMPGLVYSRPGYGQSTPNPSHEKWQPDYLHRQACEVLPLVLAALDVDRRSRPIFLFGHSDGASIALLHAALASAQLAGIILLAPHIFVEDITVQGVRQAKEAYQNTRLRERLARHHRDPDATFWGWNQIWLDPNFRGWSIENEIATVSCPILAMQGAQDEYATMAQLDGIRGRLPKAQVFEIPDCGHFPHRDQPETVLTTVRQFMNSALS
jgi:pimeloyl-ACP methyl ester carboxylesterase